MSAGATHAKLSVKDFPHAHAGLRLDRFLRFDPRTGDVPTGAKAELARALSSVPRPAGYADAFALRASLFRESPNFRLARGEVLGRLVVGLGAKGSAEFGIHLDHTWGVPILPGSALKGLAAAAAHHLYEGWQKPKEWPAARGSAKGDERTDREILFGTTDESGCVVFHDAWWIPDASDAAEKVPLDQDVMTVHHADYYGGKNAAPTDFDSPNPVPFVTCRGRYLIAIEGPAEWTQVAMELLERGLQVLGLGAKTNAGYGRIRLEVELSEAEREAQRRQEEERERAAREAAGRQARELQATEFIKGLPRADKLPSQFREKLAMLKKLEVDGLNPMARDALWSIDPKFWRKRKDEALVQEIFGERFV